MSLSCSCEVDCDYADWYWWPPKEYTTYKGMVGKRCACKRCNNMIRYGQIVGEVSRSRSATEWEEEHGIGGYDPDSINLPSVFMCERCTDLFFSFDDLGFECVSPYEDMIGLAKEYHDLYQPTKKANPKAGP